MKLIKIAIFFSISLLAFSCGSKTAKSTIAEEDMFPRGAYPLPIIEHRTEAELADIEKKVGPNYTRIEKAITVDQIKMWNREALDLLQTRTAEEGGKTHTALTTGVWLYDRAFRGVMHPPQMVAGRWITFGDNLTYEYGTYDKVDGSGKYFFSLDKLTLILIDDNPAVKPADYTVQVNGGMLIMDGSKTFQDQRLSAKYDKVSTKPTPPPTSAN